MVGWVRHTGNWIEINRHGRCLAAIVTMQDLAALEEAGGKSLARKQAEKEARRDAFQRLKQGLDGGPF